MNRKQALRHTAVAALLLGAWSCSHDGPFELEPVIPQPGQGQEIVLEVSSPDYSTRAVQEGFAYSLEPDGDGFSLEVEEVPYGVPEEGADTKAAALASVPSPLYWEGTTGTWKSETAKWPSAQVSINAGRASTGKYQTATPTAYNYYVSNKAITFAAGGSTISADNGTDVIAGCTQGATAEPSVSVTLNHVFARTGSFTLNTQSGFVVSEVSWSIAGKGGSGGTAGTYNIATGAWSGTTALASTAVSSSSDLYLVPGEYTVTVSYKLSANGVTTPFTKSSDVTLTAGKVHNFSATAVGGTITHELVVSPSNPFLFVGQTTNLTATWYTLTNGVRDGGQNVTASATWTSSATGKATVSAGTVTAISAGSATITATYGGESGSTTVDIQDDVRYELELSPATTTVELGSNVYYTATLYKITNGVSDGGSHISNDNISSWTSSNTSVATISYGNASTVGAGTTTIKATYNDWGSGIFASGTATLNVHKTIYSYRLVVSPSSASINVGSTQTYTATLYTTRDGVEDSGKAVGCDYTSSNTSVATMSGSTATGVASGTATITAETMVYQIGQPGVLVNGTSTLTVNDVITHELVVSPSSASVDVGGTTNLTATYYTYTNGVRDGGQNVTASATWTSSATGKAKVNKGTVTGVAAGSATITASYGGESGTSTITVNNAVTYGLSVSVSDNPINVGSATSVTAYFVTYVNGAYSSSSDVTAYTTWTSDNSSVASVSSSGVVTGVSSGSTYINGEYNGYSDYDSITVKDVITHSLTVTPSSASVDVGGTTDLSAIWYTLTNGVSDGGVDVTSSASWSTSSSWTATVSAGTVTGSHSGSATITARYKGESDSASITVNDVITHYLEVYAADSSIDCGGYTYVYAKYHTVTNGSDTYSLVADSASWNISPGGILSTDSVYSSFISVTGVGAGTATVTGTYNGYSDYCTVTVNGGGGGGGGGSDPVITHELVVSPGSMTIYRGGDGQLTATWYTLTDGVRDGGTDVTSSASWSSSASWKVSVGSGTVSGMSLGSATVTASYSGESGSATVDVVSPYTVTINKTSFSVVHEVTYGNASTDVQDTPDYYSVTVHDALTGTNWDVTHGVDVSPTSNSSHFYMSDGTVYGVTTLAVPANGSHTERTFVCTATLTYTDGAGTNWSWDVTITVNESAYNDTSA